MRVIPMLVVLLALSGCWPFQKETAAPIVEIGAAHGAVAEISHKNTDSLSVPDISVGKAASEKTSSVKVSGVKISGSAEVVRSEDPVVVPYFRVVFFTKDSPPELNDDSEKNMAVDARLIGVTDKTLQRITDQVYSTFVEELKEQGINVLPMLSLEISPTYQKLMNSEVQFKQTPPSGLEATHVVPTGLKISDPNRSLDGGYLDRGYASWEYGDIGNKAKNNRGKEISNILNEMNASVMDVTLYVTHTRQQIKSTLKVVTDIVVEPMIRVRAGSRLQFYGLQAFRCEGYCPNPVVNVALDQSLHTSSKVGEMKVIIKSSDKTGGFVEKTLSWLSLGSSENRADIDHYELHADEQKYQKAVTEVLNEATNKLVMGLASAR